MTPSSIGVHLSEPSAGGRLDSWKEVAAYLKRGARTVQRWEREKGLPVHRLRPDKLGSVFAFKSELDAWWSGQGATILELSPTVAVLPFADMSPRKDQAYFCDGLVEEIIHALSRTGSMHVASRTSSFQFRAPDIDSREIGRRLGVGTLLEGSVRKWGSQVRIAVQLVDAGNGFPLWSSHYDRRTWDILAVQEELARNIAGAVESAIGGAGTVAGPPPNCAPGSTTLL